MLIIVFLKVQIKGWWLGLEKQATWLLVIPACLCMLAGDWSVLELPVSYLGSSDEGANSWPFLPGLVFFKRSKEGGNSWPLSRACEHREPCDDLSLFRTRVWKHQHRTKGALKALSICTGACAARSAFGGRWCCPLSFMVWVVLFFSKGQKHHWPPSLMVKRPSFLIGIRSLDLGTW